MAKALEEIVLSTEEFLRFEGEPEVRYELIDGRLRAMAPARNPHGRLAVNAAMLIERHLRGRPPCRAQVEAGIRISEDSFYVADVAASCGPPDAEQHVAEPRLIVEVLSRSTRAFDRDRKLDDYKLIPSVVEIWLIDSERRFVQLWQRDASGWSGRDLVGQASFTSPFLAAEITLDDLYDRTVLSD